MKPHSPDNDFITFHPILLLTAKLLGQTHSNVFFKTHFSAPHAKCGEIRWPSYAWWKLIITENRMNHSLEFALVLAVQQRAHLIFLFFLHLFLVLGHFSGFYYRIENTESLSLQSTTEIRLIRDKKSKR